MSMPTPEDSLGLEIAQAEQELDAVRSEADGFLLHLTQSLDGLINQVETDANGLLSMIDHQSDLVLVDAQKTISDLGKQIDQRVNGEMLQVMGLTRPLIEMVAETQLQPTDTTLTEGIALQTTVDQQANCDALFQSYSLLAAECGRLTREYQSCLAAGGGQPCNAILVRRNDCCVRLTQMNSIVFFMCQGAYRDRAIAVMQQNGCGFALPPPPSPEPPPSTPTIRWDCDLTTGECTPSTTGRYASIAECEAACKETPTCPPPTIACPAPVVNVECPKPEEGEKKEVAFSVWQERDSKVCVITRDDEAPGAGSWNLLQSGLDLSSAAGITRTQCTPIATRPLPSSQIPGNPLALLAGPAGCRLITVPTSLFNAGTDEILQLLVGLRDSSKNATILDGLKQLIFAGLPIGDLVSRAFGSLLEQLDGIIKNAVARGLGSVPICQTGMFGNILLSVIDTITGGGIYPLVQSNRLAVNYYCPHKVPDAASATEAFIRNSMSAADMDCYVKMEGYDATVWKSIVDARRSRMSPFELTALWRRGILNTAQHDAEIRGLGFLSPEWAASYRALSVQIPPYTDIVRMMVRDVVDEVTIDWSKEDALFATKYQDQLKVWGEQQGIPELAMKYIWRAHFSIPAPGQLFTFFHRLRKDLDRWPNRDPRGTMRNALVQQDIAPRWVDFFIDTSFRPINRVDTRRAFTIGAMNETQLAQSYQNQGYSDDNIAILVDFTKKLRLQTLSNSPAARSYRDGGFTRTEAKTALQTGSIPDAEIDQALDRARQLRRAKIRQLCTKSIEQRFLLGELDDQQLRSELLGAGHELIDVDDFIEGFTCRKSARSKKVALTTLCQWVDDGIIDGGEMFDRLLKLGYAIDDATKLIKQCNLRVSRKKRATAVKASKEAVALAKQAESARKSRLKSADRRLSELARAAQDLAKGEGMLLPDALGRVNATFAALQFAFAATMDEAIQSIRLAAKQTSAEPEMPFEIAASLIIQRRRNVASPPLTTRAELAAELSSRRVLQCVVCFHQMQASESTQPLQTLCPVCGSPMTVLEIISQLGGNGEQRA